MENSVIATLAVATAYAVAFCLENAHQPVLRKLVAIFAT